MYICPIKFADFLVASYVVHYVLTLTYFYIRISWYCTVATVRYVPYANWSNTQLKLFLTQFGIDVNLSHNLP